MKTTNLESIGFVERRGSMIYTEDLGPGTAQLVLECPTPEMADLFVSVINSVVELRDKINAQLQ